MNKEIDFLIVDDDLITRDALSLRLKSLGYTTDTANTPKDALDKLRTIIPKGVILDIMMPPEFGAELDLNVGFKFAKALGQLMPELKIILLTGREDEEIEQAIYRAKGEDEINLVDFFRKPFPALAFKKALKKIVTEAH